MKKFKTKKAQTGIKNDSSIKPLDNNLWNLPVTDTPYLDQTGYATDPSQGSVFNNRTPIIPMYSRGNNAVYNRQVGTGVYRESPYLKGFNLGLTGITALANGIGENRQRNAERFQTIKSLEPHYWENMEASGLNNLPAYTQYGGGNKYPYGGGPLTSAGAKEMLRDNQAHGKKLTDKQKRYFGYIAGGGKPKKQGGGKSKEIEAEEGEVYQDIYGQVKKIDDNAGTHEEGGVQLDDAYRVLEDTSDKRKDKASKLLHITPTELEDMLDVKPKSSVSHAKAFDLTREKHDKFKNKIKKANERINEYPDMDVLAAHSVKLNLKTMDDIPTPEDTFSVLFRHQEAIKQAEGINDDGKIGRKKYGVKKAQAGAQIPIYPGGKTPQGRIRPDGQPNAFNFPGGLPALIKKWQDAGYDMSGVTSAEQFQGRTYDILNGTPGGKEVLRKMWQSGNTALGLKKGLLTNRFPKGDFRNATLNDEDLSSLKAAYMDNNLGSRTITPEILESQVDEPNPVVPERSNAPIDTSVDVNPNFITQPANRFHERTNWYDLAPGMLSLADSMGREPELYNPANFSQLRYKLLDPTSSLNANQADFNAVSQQLGNDPSGSGVGPANAGNLLVQKYKANNQVLSNYENQNSQIKNREIDYNTNVRDRQSVADAQSRESYYNKVLLSRDNQRLQRLSAVENLSRVAALKARQNASGNLVLKLSPAFNQYGDYNGYQHLFSTPPENFLPPDVPIPSTRYKPKKTIRTETFKDASGRVMSTRTIN